MRSIALFAALCSVAVCETQKEFLNNSCETLCHMQKKAGKETNVNLTIPLKGCCDDAASCVLPARFYNLPCVKELMDICLNQSTSNLTWRTQHLCSGNLNSNETGREFNRSRKCFKNISVDWNNINEKVLPVRHQKLLHKWKREDWEFVLKMSTQTCAERISMTPSSVAIKFKYPSFAKRENYDKKFVHAFYAPVSYLAMKKGDHDMLTVLGEAVNHLWVTLSIGITWMLISGVIIWLLVSLVVRYVCSTSLVCIFYMVLVKAGGISTQSAQFFCRILFIRERGTIHPRGLRMLP